VCDRVGAVDADDARFEGLPERIEHRRRELGRLSNELVIHPCDIVNYE
jgi:hypothetical protein